MKLVICEKKDQALSIGKGLGFNAKSLPIIGNYKGAQYKIVAAKGHLVQLKELKEVNPNVSWDDPNSLLPLPNKFPIAPGKDYPNVPSNLQPRVYLKRISDELKGQLDEVIIATDSDREGEAIGRNILLYTKYKGKARRAWLAAGLDSKSVQEAFDNLRPLDDSYGLYMAAIARSRADWLYMSLVIAYTYFGSFSIFGQNLGRGSGKSRVISVGGVQTPSLAMIVNLEDKINNFVPVEHFKFNADFKGTTSTVTANYQPKVTEDIILSQPEGVNWIPSTATPKENEPEPLDKPQFVCVEKAQAFVKRLEENGSKATIKSVRTRRRLENPPKPFELADAQSEISKACNTDSGTAQSILEDLYLQGWLSYPRTDERELPSNLYEKETLHSMLKAGSHIPELKEQAQTALAIHSGNHPEIKPFKPKVYVDKDMPHWGLSPTHKLMTTSDFNSLMPSSTKGGKNPKYSQADMQKAYVIILKQYLQAHYPPAEYDVQEIEFELPVEDMLGNKLSCFTTKVEKLVVPGWIDAFSSKKKEEKDFASLKENETVVLTKAHIKKEVTQKPKRYTYNNFPKAMKNVARDVTDPKLKKLLKETKGIGTPATRKNILQTLEDREYICNKKGTIHPTKKGMDLIHNVVPKWLKQPETRALWEDYLFKITKEKDTQKATSMMQNFVSKESEKIELLIKGLIQKHSSNLGERIKPTPRKVTPKMKEAIKRIANSKNIKVPPGTLTNPEKASAFLDANISGGKSNSGNNSPSEKQVALAQKLYDNLPEEMAAEVDFEKIRLDSSLLSSFIDTNKKYLPPSEGQIGFAKKLLSSLPGYASPENVDEILKYAEKCSTFIDEQIKAQKEQRFRKQ